MPMYSPDSTIIRTPQSPTETTAEQIDALFTVISKERDQGITKPPVGLGRAILDAARTWRGVTVDANVMAGQICQECAGWTSYWASRNNPAGLGVDGTPGAGNTFVTLAGGLAAYVAHLLDYAVGEGQWSVSDPRFAAAKQAGYLGKCPTLHDLNGRWAVPGPTYGEGIAALANRLLTMEGGAMPPVDISGYVPPPITQQWFEPNGVSYMGVDMVMAGVCIHETGNTSPTAEAQQNVNYMKSQECIQRQASWHTTVGRDIIIETIPSTKQAYHASDDTGPGNTTRMGIEGVVCYPVSSPDFDRVLQNHAWYAARMLRLHNLPLTANQGKTGTLAQHHDFARDGKDCPQVYRDTPGLWDRFVAFAQAFYDRNEWAVPAPPVKLVIPSNPFGNYGFVLGFKAWCEQIGNARNPADPNAGIVSVIGFPKADEYAGSDGLTYQICERGTLQYTPGTNPPFDIVVLPCGVAIPPAKG